MASGRPPSPSPAPLTALSVSSFPSSAGFSHEDFQAAGSSEAERTAPPTRDLPAREAPFSTTAPTLKLLNHHPLLEGFFPEEPPPREGSQPAPLLAWAPPRRPPAPGPAATPTPTAASPTSEPAGAVNPRDRQAAHISPGSSGVAGVALSSPRDRSPGATSRRGPETTAAPVAGPCCWNLTGPRGALASPLPSNTPYENGWLECAYTISVYPGYGVEIRVQNISLAEGETITVETLGSLEPLPLANESFLMRGQVVRGPTNQVLVRFQSPSPANPGTFHFHFEAYMLSCAFPARPAYGDVSVSSTHPGGQACFSCVVGYQLVGKPCLSCLNATHPFWSRQEPTCVAACGGVIQNATTGRVVSPGFPANYSNNLTCHWVLEAPPGQRLHLHFEKVSLAEDDDRLIIRNGNNIEAPPVYDSYEVEYLPIEGLVSTSRGFFIEFSTDSGGVAAGVALRYEAFRPGHCYEPFVKYGNFTSSNGSYKVGTTVEFACEPGYTLEQGSVIIECVDPANPQWNETEPACRAVCSGEITDASGVVLSPNWPEPYGKGQDCIWGVHVEEDKRIMLDIRVLRLGKGDTLTFYDGDDLTARILGQYSGSHRPFQLFTSMADVTIQFQSDPGSSAVGYRQGFIVHFAEVPRNDTCPELPEIPNGWKTTSHPELIHGAVVTYHCYPGYELVGTELLMCHWDLVWSGDLPSCQKVTACPDPGDVEHSRRVVSTSKFPVGSTIQFLCDGGFVLAGAAEIACHDRPAGGPKWSDRLPKCIPEVYEPCRNPGGPEHSTQHPEKRLYQTGASLRFTCAAGYLLLGNAVVRCLPGHPSHWSGPPPLCKTASSNEFHANPKLDAVAKVMPARDPWQGSSVAFAIFLPVAVVGLLLGTVYLYVSRHQGKSSLPAPLSTSQSYDHIRGGAAFDNPTYDTREMPAAAYEVSI
ncbi:seizure protein 6 homolog isoform X2 [Crotalus tigris]|uniref:seizure protein 6 homolog isoform X2 n=1 Tax=Crotalus tigris TaxID=88082 RepID=UPI00192F8B0B|nr:seizure protein 6 homolog isoform X2 [Crotalus tigris]